ncbi:DUF397 domain-containing protein [Saccharopolyspora karakumensis]|uniref:DUF397 domain-containing protein n=1 Tax=Saccharopolyspora karakumensis TaxID=2530386 RepID=A0A4R5BF72_9PSEU|nr:DUF397 domain-containing protein [Saccharopolyspora karakumensis]TDD85208.1 DUF397 domain-containing protein [Saccharopolyspora karakumensis]
MASSVPVTGWRKSSRSQGAETCVEVGRVSDAGAAVRDTKNRAAGHFTTTAPQWQNFVEAIKAGRFDR